METDLNRTICLRTSSGGVPQVGMSHWWGAPDLPPEVPYPYVRIKDELPDGGVDEYDEPLTFLFQLRLEDIAHIETGLPKEGILHVFAPLDYYLGELDSPLDYHDDPVVLYTPATDGLEPYEITWEGTDESIFRPAERIIIGQGEDIILFGNPIHEEIADAHSNQTCLLMLEENEEWGLRFLDCGTYYIFLEKDFAKTLAEAVKAHPGRTINLKASGDLFFY